MNAQFAELREAVGAPSPKVLEPTRGGASRLDSSANSSGSSSSIQKLDRRVTELAALVKGLSDCACFSTEVANEKAQDSRQQLEDSFRHKIREMEGKLESKVIGAGRSAIVATEHMEVRLSEALEKVRVRLKKLESLHVESRIKEVEATTQARNDVEVLLEERLRGAWQEIVEMRENVDFYRKEQTDGPALLLAGLQRCEATVAETAASTQAILQKHQLMLHDLKNGLEAKASKNMAEKGLSSCKDQAVHLAESIEKLSVEAAELGSACRAGLEAHEVDIYRCVERIKQLAQITCPETTHSPTGSPERKVTRS